jgi:drug/metabolite transporter (DMT)-like permease
MIQRVILSIAALFHGASGAQSVAHASNLRSGRSLRPDGQVADILDRSCAEENLFEDSLDKVSYAFFDAHLSNTIEDSSYVHQLVDAAGSRMHGHDISPGHAKAIMPRLQAWRDAVLRTRHNNKREASLNANKDNNTAPKDHRRKIVKPADVRKHSDEIAIDEDANEANPAPTCASTVPANDPYWSQVDSYWVCNHKHACTPYNVCRYSNNCQKTFTNLERVMSIRRTIQAAHQFLTTFGVSYMLFGGTVIGAYRCKDVLPWDLDSDVAIWNDDFPKLLSLLSKAPYAAGHRNEGRYIDLAAHGLPGFTLMEKYTGCMPLILVDQSTGFFTDMFPMRPDTTDPSKMMSPWQAGKVSCDANALFPGCQHSRCDTWSYSVTLPTSQCQIYTHWLNCAHNLQGFLYEYYGPSVDTPDRPTRIKEKGESHSFEGKRKEVSANKSESAAFLSAEVHRTDPTDPATMSTSARSIYGLITGLVFVVPWVMWITGVPRTAVVFTFYLGLYMAWAMLTYATRGGSHSSGMLVLNALIFKLAVSLVLWRSWEGSSYLDLPHIAWEARGPLFQYVVPAGLYAVSDIIRTNALRATDASTFAILFNSRMLFLALVWQWVMNRKLRLLHWLSLTAVLVGCALKEFPHIETSRENARYWAYVDIVLLGVITSIATVWNEKLLQTRADVGVSLQNLAMYIWGIMCTLCVVMVWAVLDPGQLMSPFNWEAWQAIWGEPLVLTSAFVLAIYGVATAYFLRYLSNITREVTLGAFAPLLSVAMDFILFKLRLSLLEHIGLALVLFGVVLFAFKPVLAIDADEEKQSPRKLANPKEDDATDTAESTRSSDEQAEASSSEPDQEQQKQIA